MSMALRLIRMIERMDNLSVNDKYPPREDYPDDMAYLEALYAMINKDFFDNQLETPSFTWVKTKMGTADKFQGGHYVTQDKKLAMNRRFIMFPQVFIEILKHEMCHQAVAEIDQENEKRFHGPIWRSWANKVGIDPKGTIHITKEMVDAMRTDSENEYKNSNIVYLFGERPRKGKKRDKMISPFGF